MFIIVHMNISLKSQIVLKNFFISYSLSDTYIPGMYYEYMILNKQITWSKYIPIQAQIEGIKLNKLGLKDLDSTVEYEAHRLCLLTHIYSSFIHP